MKSKKLTKDIRKKIFEQCKYSNTKSAIKIEIGDEVFLFNPNKNKLNTDNYSIILMYTERILSGKFFRF